MKIRQWRKVERKKSGTREDEKYLYQPGCKHGKKSFGVCNVATKDQESFSFFGFRTIFLNTRNGFYNRENLSVGNFPQQNKRND